MANLTISGDTSGSVTLSAPAIAGSPVVTLPSATGTVALTSQVYGNSTVTSGTTNITLTSASNRVQNVSFTAADKSVTLPDATTMQLGGPHFTIYNAGPYSFEIKTNGGYSIAYSTPGDTYEFSLISQSTVNGLWVDTVRGAARLGYITQTASNIAYFNTVRDPGANRGAVKAVPLTSNSVLISYLTSATACNAIVATWSGSSWSYGSPVVLSSVVTDGAVLPSVALTETTGLLGVDEGTSEVLYPFSVSGTTISLGTKSADSNVDNAFALVRLSNTTAIFNSDFQMRAVFYNGLSAPVLGTFVTIGAMSTGMSFSMIDGTNGVAVGGNGTAGRASTFTVSNVTITSGTGVAWPGQWPSTAAYCYTSGGGDLIATTVAEDNPNLAAAYYVFTTRRGTISGGTVTQTGGGETLLDFQYPPLVGLPVMATNTSGIFVSTVSPQLGGFENNFQLDSAIRDFSTIIPQNYEPNVGFSTNGVGYRNPKYTIFDAKPMSSTRYIIISDNSQWAVRRATDDALQSPSILSNGTTWYLTIADAMS